MTRLTILAMLALSACAEVPADWGFAENAPRRALVPTHYADSPQIIGNDGTGLFFTADGVSAEGFQNDGCGLFFDTCEGN